MKNRSVHEVYTIFVTQLMKSFMERNIKPANIWCLIQNYMKQSVIEGKDIHRHYLLHDQHHLLHTSSYLKVLVFKDEASHESIAIK